MTKIEELQYYYDKYPDLSPQLILKISVTKYGTVFSDAALARLQEKDYRFTKAEPFGIPLEVRKKDFYTPGAVIFRDGGSVLVNYGEPYADPYLVDYDPEEDVFLLTENGILADTIDFLPRPDFFDGVTGKGTPMDLVGGTCTTQRLLINGFQRCRFWENGEQCHYCALFGADSVIGEVDTDDIRDTVREAVKEPGRFTEVSVSGGSDFSGDPPFSNEIARYIRVLQTVGADFPDKMEMQLMAPAYKKEDLKRLYEETPLTSYRPNIEVWDPASFRRMCPGKEHWIGREEWIKRMVEAVEVFGPGRVYTQMVLGAELAGPDGLDSVEYALESAFEGSEFFSKNGISCHVEIWRPNKMERLGWQPMQDLDYFIRLSQVFHDTRRRHGLLSVETNFMRGSDNPDSDLERGDYAPDVSVPSRAVRAIMPKEFYKTAGLPEELASVLMKGTDALLLTPADGPQAPENGAISVSDVFSPDGRRVLIPLASDRSRLTSVLIKMLWFQQDAGLLLRTGSGRLLKATCRVYRYHTVGKQFRHMLDHVRGNNPAADRAAAAELHILSVEPAAEPDGLRVTDAGSRYCHSHLDRQLSR